MAHSIQLPSLCINGPEDIKQINCRNLLYRIYKIANICPISLDKYEISLHFHCEVLKFQLRFSLVASFQLLCHSSFFFRLMTSQKEKCHIILTSTRAFHIPIVTREKAYCMFEKANAAMPFPLCATTKSYRVIYNFSLEVWPEIKSFLQPNAWDFHDDEKA